MTAPLHLTITTPFNVLVDVPEVVSIRAEDTSGSFGILPGHVDFLTAFPVSVVRWKNSKGKTHYCALRGGILTVSEGNRAAIACRQGMLGDDLEKLASDFAAMQANEADAERKARTEQTQMHARAVRQLMSYLNPQDRSGTEHLGFKDGPQ